MKPEKLNTINNIILTIPPALTINPSLPAHPPEIIETSSPLEKLANALSPFKAFKEGFERAIAKYITGGQEVKKTVTSETPIKNTETALMEKIVKSLLHDFHSVRFLKHRDTYVAIMNGRIYQFSLLVERCDFNQISLTETELSHYHSMIEKHQFSMNPSFSPYQFAQLNSHKEIRKLTFAEREALNIYTGPGYHAMNTFLRGGMDDVVMSYSVLGFSKKERTNLALKETLLHAAIAVSGLNKLPDFVPPVGPDGSRQKYLYRAENSLPEDILKKRKWAVLTGKPTKEMGFISTSFLKPSEAFFSEFSKSGILIESLKAKKITDLSCFESEREVLLPPTQMLWLHQKDVVTDVFKKTIPLFIAKPVTINETHPVKSEETFVQTLTPEENALLGIDIT